MGRERLQTNGTPRKPRTPQDSELAAMGSILRTLSGLDAPTRARVMTYVNERVASDADIERASRSGDEV